MATTKINENCHHLQNDLHKCKLNLEKFQFDILCRFGVIKESLPGGSESAPSPGEVGLNSHKSRSSDILQCNRMDRCIITSFGN